MRRTTKSLICVPTGDRRPSHHLSRQQYNGRNYATCDRQILERYDQGSLQHCDRRPCLEDTNRQPAEAKSTCPIAAFEKRRLWTSLPVTVADLQHVVCSRDATSTRTLRRFHTFQFRNYQEESIAKDDEPALLHNAI
jgi:hypothetical protein